MVPCREVTWGYSTATRGVLKDEEPFFQDVIDDVSLTVFYASDFCIWGLPRFRPTIVGRVDLKMGDWSPTCQFPWGKNMIIHWNWLDIPSTLHTSSLGISGLGMST